MNLFDTLIVQPIFNIILAIYGVLPGHDFGLSLVIFAVLVRVVMLPLVKKQLHQTRVMRAVQPELKKIREKAKGNKALEGQLMMELYRERGVNPFGSFAILLVQMPVFIALYSVVQVITTHRDQIAAYTYNWLETLLQPVRAIAENPAGFREGFLGIDLTQHAIGQAGAISLPLLVLAGISAGLQYYQSKQLTPQVSSGKKLRDMFRDSASGEAVDQAEVSALMGQRMLLIFPAIAFAVALYLPGALVLFYAVSSLVAVIQQRSILAEDVEEMVHLSESPSATKRPTARSAKGRAEAAADATIVAEAAVNKSVGKKRSRRKRQ